MPAMWHTTASILGLNQCGGSITTSYNTGWMRGSNPGTLFSVGITSIFFSPLTLSEGGRDHRQEPVFPRVQWCHSPLCRTWLSPFLSDSDLNEANEAHCFSSVLGLILFISSTLKQFLTLLHHPCASSSYAHSNSHLRQPLGGLGGDKAWFAS